MGKGDGGREGSSFNAPAQNSTIIAQQNADRFQNRLARERQRTFKYTKRNY